MEDAMRQKSYEVKFTDEYRRERHKTTVKAKDPAAAEEKARCAKGPQSSGGYVLYHWTAEVKELE